MQFRLVRLRAVTRDYAETALAIIKRVRKAQLCLPVAQLCSTSEH